MHDNSWINYYPRPQFKRNSFYSLNGEWLLNNHPILIPFSPQASLSQYQHHITDHLHYQKTFQLPKDFYNHHDHVILHFGAVDQITKVSLNNYDIGEHQGGYLPFSFDITEALQEDNTLIVDVIDTLSHDYPYGKQKKKRGGMWYTPVSGIWQSVWIEAVPKQSIDHIKITPSLTGIDIEVTTKAPSYQITIPLDHHTFQHTYENKRVHIDLSHESDNLHLWTVDDPYLYDIIIETETDRIESYFALRTVKIINNTIFFNQKPIFLNGVLDQGYYHDGLYLPKTPQEYIQDVLRMKKLGFNTLRKHIKIEPEIYYYACDKYGMFIVQDMVNNGSYHWLLDTALPNLGLQYRPDYLFNHKKQQHIFTKHMLDTLKHLYNHPSIIAYTIFNEGWGQFHADKMYHLCQQEDPTRFYDATSGWFHQKESDVHSLHVYFRNKVLASHHNKPLFLSECGGYTRSIEDHLYKKDAHYGYGYTHSEKELTDKIIQLYEEMIFPSLAHGLCGCIYTQLSDIEDEINGLYTYDRQICKVNQQRLFDLSQKLYTSFIDHKKSIRYNK